MDHRWDSFQVTPEEQFLDQLPLIERVTAAVCRRHCCFGDDAEEFDARVKERLIEGDYAVLRKFKGKSSLATYLTTVIHNLFRDFRISRWGRWRPSAAARRLGPVAVRLETLVSRDGLTFDEASRMLRLNYGVEESEQRLEEIAGQLPSRAPRRFEGEERIARLGSRNGIERRVTDGEKASIVRKAQSALDRALAGLEAEDRLLLKMRYLENFTVAAIAEALRLPQRPLYSRFDRCHARLHRSLEEQGLSRDEVRDILGWEGTELRLDLDAGEKNSGISSVQEEGGL